MARLVAVVAAAALVLAGLTPVVGAQEGIDAPTAQTTSGFADVTGGVHQPAIDALNALGLFSGTECGQDMFCPGGEMKRWTMAVWLVRILDKAEPRAASESSFADVDFEKWYLAHIERLAELEVTKGCATDPLRFCPDDPVTRAQMATFLTRALDLDLDPAEHSGEGLITLMAEINTSALSERRDPSPWGSVAAHELAHSLGLADLYPYDSDRFERPEPPTQRVWVHSEFGLMGLHTAFLAHPDDSRIEITGRYSYGNRVTGYTYCLKAAEMLAWSRWQLGWLDESQILCLTGERSRVTLGPVADPGDAPAMAAVPLSETEVLVVEVRLKTGYDAAQEQRHADGALTTVPALATEGVLVYVVDASLGSGQLPIMIAGDSGNGQADGYPILKRGEQVVVRGYTVTLVSRRRGTYIVAISKNAT